MRDWLDSSSYGIQTIEDANEFHFMMTDNLGMKMTRESWRGHRHRYNTLASRVKMKRRMR